MYPTKIDQPSGWFAIHLHPNKLWVENSARFVKKRKINHTIHEYQHDSGCDSYGLEAAEKIGVAEAQVFKTLVVSLNNQELAVAIIPVSSMLSMKLMAKAAAAKKAQMAAQKEVERATGYVLGGVSPLGQKKKLKTVIDASAKNYTTIYISGGRRGLDIELAADDLQGLVDGVLAPLCQ